MEFLTILLSGLLGLASPTGLVTEKVATNTARSLFTRTEQLQVRVDNPPSHQLLQGKIQKVRIAGRGLLLKQPEIRLAVLEIETDSINLDISSFRQGKPKLKQPLQAGMRLVLNSQDINQALKSKAIANKLANIGLNILQTPSSEQQSLLVVNPRLELSPNRLRLQAELTEANAPPLAIKVELGLKIIAGQQIQLIDPVVYVNQERVPQQIIDAVASNIDRQLDLANLEAYGIRAKVLKLAISQEKLEIAAFVRVDTSSPFFEKS